VGERLPSCSFEGLGGRAPVRLAALRGKPLVLNFWASWCPNCVAEMPAFQKVYSDLAGQVGFVGMDLLDLEGETRIAAEAFAKTTRVTYPLAYDPGGGLYSHFSLRIVHPVMPVTVFVDAQGVLRERRFGELAEDDLRFVIREHFGIG
jgi:thiol-disulfide isomerase/thioredoxin